MNPADNPPPLEPAPPPVKNLELKAALLLLVLLLLVVGSALYVAYARGVFERTQRLVLVAQDSEGVSVGMHMTFAGFPIGRISRIDLAEDGNVHFLIDVPLKDAKWLRTSSVFTMEKSLVGGTRLRAFSGVLSNPPLEDGAMRQVLAGDAAAEIPGIVADAKEVIANIKAMTADDAALALSLANLQAATKRLNGPHGAMDMLLGNEADAKKVAEVLTHTSTVLNRVDSLVANANRQIFGQGAGPGGSAQGGLVQDARGTVQQLDRLLGEARVSLQKVDKILVDAQAITTNAREATTDLGQLRAEVDASLRKVDSLINEVNRLWPFKRDTRIELK